jgi:hypothetical protein
MAMPILALVESDRPTSAAQQELRRLNEEMASASAAIDATAVPIAKPEQARAAPSLRPPHPTLFRTFPGSGNSVGGLPARRSPPGAAAAHTVAALAGF